MQIHGILALVGGLGDLEGTKQKDSVSRKSNVRVSEMTTGDRSPEGQP